MAMTCSGMAYSWSRWNTDVQDLQKLVIQGCEQTVDEPLLEVSQASRHALRRVANTCVSTCYKNVLCHVVEPSVRYKLGY